MGRWLASTRRRFDFTHHYVALPAEHAPSVGCTRRALPPAFDPVELEKERKVVIEETAPRGLSHGRIYDVFMATCFAGTAMRIPSWHAREPVGPGSRAAAGLLAAALRARQLQSFVETSSRRPCFPKWSVVLIEPQPVEVSNGCPFPAVPDEPVRVETRSDISQAYMLAGYVVPRPAGTRDLYALDVLSTLLGEGRSSRLHRRLTEELGLCPDVRTSYFDMKHLGLFYTDLSFEDPATRASEEPSAQLERVRQAPPSEKEIEKAKKMLVSGFAFSNERASLIADLAHRIHSRLEDALAYIECIRSVAAEEVVSAARKYLVGENYREVRMRPGA
ncbi:insulinase family protein [bacterium]|nr:insulinase family protein [bacterium]